MRPLGLATDLSPQLPSNPDLFCLLPSLDGEVVERVAVTEATTFEGIVRAAHRAVGPIDPELKPCLTWKLSCNRKGTHAAHLDSAEEWARALNSARKVSRHKKRADVEIVVGYDEPQVFTIFSVQPYLMNLFHSAEVEDFNLRTTCQRSACVTKTDGGNVLYITSHIRPRLL